MYMYVNIYRLNALCILCLLKIIYYFYNLFDNHFSQQFYVVHVGLQFLSMKVPLKSLPCFEKNDKPIPDWVSQKTMTPTFEGQVRLGLVLSNIERLIIIQH